jgi:hypothetical protein
MVEDPRRLDGAEPDARTPRRSFRTWVILLLVWTVGLIVWVIYLVAILYVLYKVF